MNGNKRLDYCSSQELQDLAPTPENLFILEEQTNDLMHPSQQQSGQPGSHLTEQLTTGLSTERLQSIYFKLSHTSQNILIALGIFSLFVLILLFIRSPLSVVVLLLIFLQPLVVLYFIYWRDRRKFAQLDYVIKMFFVGFFLSTTQSVVLESLLQYVVMFVAIILYLLIHGLPAQQTATDDPGDGPPASAEIRVQLAELGGRFHQLLTDLLPWRGITVLYSDPSEIALARERHARFDALQRSASGIAEFFLSPGAHAPPTALGDIAAEFLVEPLGNQPSFQPTSLPTPITDNDQFLVENVLLVLFVLFLMAFLVAAGVEETMKHFVVRCCRFPTPLKDPNVVLVYLVAGALGFATAENIEYVFGINSSPIPGTSKFVGELVVLALRILLPVHLICSVLQAANLSKVCLSCSLCSDLTSSARLCCRLVGGAGHLADESAFHSAARAGAARFLRLLPLRDGFRAVRLAHRVRRLRRLHLRLSLRHRGRRRVLGLSLVQGGRVAPPAELAPGHFRGRPSDEQHALIHHTTPHTSTSPLILYSKQSSLSLNDRPKSSFQ